MSLQKKRFRRALPHGGALLLALLATLFFTLGSDRSAHAAGVTPLLNEFVANHTGSDSDAFLEIFGAANNDYSLYTLLEIEGDSGSTSGNIDDVANVGTTNAAGYWTSDIDMENGTITVLLVENFTGAANDDIDTDDDGVIDNAPWDAIIDSVAVDDGGTDDLTYSPVVLEEFFDGQPFSPGGASRIPNGTDTDAVDDWVRNAFNGAGLPSFPGATAAPGDAINTPGALNLVAADEPVLNEFVANHTGSDSDAFLEIFGTGETDYSLYTLLEIEGDSGSTSGNIDDVANVGTTNAAGYWTSDIDMENGTITVLLVENFTGAANDDIDTNDDGVIDNAPWDAIIDSVAVDDGGTDDLTYSPVVLEEFFDGQPFSPGGASRIPNGTDTDAVDDWVRNAFNGAGLPSFPGATAAPGDAINTPGALNLVAADEPVLNEFVANHTGSDSDAFLEIFGTGETDYSLYTLLEIEGDSGSTSGNIDDVANVGTTNAAGYWTSDIDMENGTITVLLVENFTGAANDDIDTDDDGVIDNAPWDAIIDSVAVDDGGTDDLTYSPVVLEEFFDGQPFSPGGASRIPNGTDTDAVDDWVRNAFNGAGLPSFPGATAAPGDAINTPGTENEVAAAAAELVINEIMQNPSAVADGSGEWFELYNPTGDDIDIDGWTIADAGSDSHVIDNGGPLLVPVGGYLILGNNTDSGTNGGVNVDYGYGSSWFLSNSGDEVLLLDGSGAEIDRVEYDGGPDFPDPSGASMILDDPTNDNNVADNWCVSTSSYGDGDLGTPGAVNDDCDAVAIGVCGDPATFIHDVQGEGDTSPLLGQIGIIVEGVVVGDFQDTGDELSGFYVQEEDLDADANAATSEGLFIFDNGFGVDVNVGDVVRVQGTVDEFFDLTQLDTITDILVCDGPNGSGIGASPANITLPVSAIADLEAYEGMAVAMTQTLYVTDNFNTGRFGEVTLSVDGRLFQGTHLFDPGAAALAQADLNQRSQIQLDDGSTIQNPLPLPPYLGPNDTLRAGDTTDGLSGVLSYSFGAYEIHPTQVVSFTRVNTRNDMPADVGGTLRVATFNVLNFFTTIDNGDPICGPSGDLDCRGADSVDEFNRQRDKIIAAMVDLDADIIGINEIENNESAALQSLVDGLNAVVGAGTYDYVDTGFIGTDAIKVGFLYDTTTVAPVGDFAILDSSVDPIFLDSKNRPALAQTFEEIATGERFTAVANHLKSKGSSCDDVGDPDPGDGQGNCAGVRTDAATALVNWLQTDPTGSGDADFMILGDLNSYAMEDPIDVLEAGGYVDLLDAYLGVGAYSYVFFGEAGYLDYIMTNQSLTADVTGVTVWHINADEPRALDYNDFNQPQLYNDDPYRASDHDPIVVGLNLAAPTDVALTGLGGETGGPPAAQALWLLLPLTFLLAGWIFFRRGEETGAG